MYLLCVVYVYTFYDWNNWFFENMNLLMNWFILILNTFIEGTIISFYFYSSLSPPVCPVSPPISIRMYLFHWTMIPRYWNESKWKFNCLLGCSWCYTCVLVSALIFRWFPFSFFIYLFCRSRFIWNMIYYVSFDFDMFIISC